MAKIEIRKATVEDAELIFRFIKELADYEHALHEVATDVDSIKSSLFKPSSTTHAVICTSDSKPIGMAIYFLNYSTWLGKHGLYLEDLYITPESRGEGAGKALLKYLARLAVTNDFGRFEWSVLDWNEPAIRFYESIGAKAQSEWIGYRLEGQSLSDFATS